MSEYQFVEKPLLTQLDSMGWQVIDQGNMARYRIRPAQYRAWREQW